MALPRQFTDGDYTAIEQVDGKRLDFPFTESPSPDRFAKATERDMEVATDSYVPRTPTRTSYTNLLLRSEAIDNASWTKTNTTVTADATTAPDGQVTMDWLKESAANAVHTVGQAAAVAATAANLSVFAQSAGRDYLQLKFTDSAAATFSAFFDLALGRVFSMAANTTAVIQAMGDSQFRCSIAFTPAAGSGTSLVSISTDGSTTSYAGDTAKGLYLWGFDLKNAAAVGPYISTTTVSRAMSSPDVDVDDPLQYLVTESKPRAMEANVLQLTRGFARIPAAQVTYGNAAFTRPVLDDIFSGSTYAATLDKGVSSTLWTSRKTVTVVGPVTLATQTTTNNDAVPNLRSNGLSVTLKLGGVGPTAIDFSGSADTIEGLLLAAFGGVTFSVIASESTVDFTTSSPTVHSVNCNTAGWQISGSGNAYSVTPTTASTPATSVISPSANQSYRTFTTSAAHGFVAGDLLALWLGNRVVARTFVMAVPTTTTLRVPLADVNGADFLCDRAAVSAAGTRYVNGVKYCSARLTQSFYIPGVSVGITTPADIPQPDVIMSAQGWLDIIVAGTAYGAIQVSELDSWRGPIYAQTVTEIQVADALETM